MDVDVIGTKKAGMKKRTDYELTIHRERAGCLLADYCCPSCSSDTVMVMRKERVDSGNVYASRAASDLTQ